MTDKDYVLTLPHLPKPMLKAVKKSDALDHWEHASDGFWIVSDMVGNVTIGTNNTIKCRLKRKTGNVDQK